MAGTAGGPDETRPAWLVERTWRETNQVIHITVDTNHRTVVVFDGRGSMEGARALIQLVDEIRDHLGHHILIEALVDMRRLDGAPLRAQFLIGKWLLTRKKQIQKVAVFGGKPFEMGLARAIMTIAGMGSKAWFGNHLADALGFLQWPQERYPA
ncbi:MAG: STAS/SEC14 domain-containing protein [Deltaproteobacteria bacterium]|nr:STAS/SEC14 domain-containing protein [Deltaproteobacteria bacterium]